MHPIARHKSDALAQLLAVFARATFALAACTLLAAVCARSAYAQEPDGIAAAAPAQALEQTLVQTIAGSEKSVVAVARVRRDLPGETVRTESLPDPFSLRAAPGRALAPTDPNFVPNDYGAGVIVDRRGLILTSYSVLGDDSDYFIITSDRRVYKAWIKAADPRSDLAVLGMDGADVVSANLVPMRMGDAASLRKGQFVISLGNPHAVARDGQVSASWGIVANLARKIPSDPDETDPASKRSLHHFGTLIQTDLHMHEGSGGGPLLNLHGEMVGLCVTLATAAGCESSQGMAIPVDDTFRRALEVLKQGREVEYGFLGIRPVNLSAQLVLAGIQGTRVEQIVPGTPAARYGLRDSDVVTSVNGKPIYDADGLVLEVGRLPVEATARLAVLRNGSKLNVDVTLSKYPVRGKKFFTVRSEAWRGLRIDYPSAMLDDDNFMRSRSLLVDDAVVVAEVDPNTIAAQSGMKPGMLISAVDGQPVRTPKEFRAATSNKAGAVMLKLEAGDQVNNTVVVPAK